HLQLTGYRLPTEKEWEYACRAKTTTSRAFGDSEEMLDYYAWYGHKARNRAWPVGLLKPNDFGLFDMYGNASEWTDDTGYRPTSPPGKENDGSIVLITDLNVHRGGNFTLSAVQLRSAARFTAGVKAINYTVGFRVARTYPFPP